MLAIENYGCKCQEEVQSAYFNQTSVTLHPMVIYYRDSDNKLAHKSLTVISDTMSHAAPTVLAFLDQAIDCIKEIDPGVKMIHIWTDSPTSQYRNKAIFHAVGNFENLYGISARWNYFEAGHGKGPCDGLGGTVKRMADEAVKTEKAVIQEAKDFFAWAQSSSMSAVKFLFVSKDECEQKAAELKKLSLKPIKGTMEVHAVSGQGHSTVMTRAVSCYCDLCLEGSFCTGWRKGVVVSEVQLQSASDPSAGPENNPCCSTGGECNDLRSYVCCCSL